MTLPNALTLSRFVFAFVLIPLLVFHWPFSKTAALVLFIISGITDYLDGHLARTRYGITPFGSLMDPVTDKVVVCAAFITFVELHLVRAIVVVVIVAREFMVTGLRLLALNQGQMISAGRWGKHKTVWQIVAVVVILGGLAIRDDVIRPDSPVLAGYNRIFGMIAHWGSVAVAVVTVVSGVMYLVQHRDLVKRHV